MKNRISSAFTQKYNKQNLSQKSLSISKFNSTESKIKKNEKKNYFSLLTQIKNKKINLGTPPTLFHYFIKKNAEKSINIRLSYLVKPELQDSLINDKTSVQKNTSFPKTSFNTSFKQKNLFNNKTSKTPKAPVNRILKLKKDKVFIKSSEAKKYIPMERRDSYKKFVEKMNQNNYMKYSNSNSEYVHKIKTDIYLTQGNIKEKLEKKRNDKYLQYLREKFEEGKEGNDRVYYPSLELVKLKKKIRAILLKDSEEQPEEFFNNYVNKVNFLEDSYRPPNIRNNLINYKYKDLYGFENLYGLQCLNRISKNTLNNLAKAKIRAQREKEFMENYLKEKGKITEKYIYYKKLASDDIYNSKEEIEKIIYKDYYIKPDDLVRIIKNEENLEKSENTEEYRDYFEDKYETNREVFIPDPKMKKCIFHFDDYKK